MSRKSRLSQVLEVENRAEEDEAPPPGSKLAQRRSQGPAERQREEGLRAFDLRVAGVKPPDWGGETFTVKPVQVLGWSWFCSSAALELPWAGEGG